MNYLKGEILEERGFYQTESLFALSRSLRAEGHLPEAEMLFQNQREAIGWTYWEFLLMPPL